MRAAHTVARHADTLVVPASARMRCGSTATGGRDASPIMDAPATPPWRIWSALTRSHARQHLAGFVCRRAITSAIQLRARPQPLARPFTLNPQWSDVHGRLPGKELSASFMARSRHSRQSAEPTTADPLPMRLAIRNKVRPPPIRKRCAPHPVAEVLCNAPELSRGALSAFWSRLAYPCALAGRLPSVTWMESCVVPRTTVSVTCVFGLSLDRMEARSEPLATCCPFTAVMTSPT